MQAEASRAAPGSAFQSTGWVGYAASTWALLFAALSFYWAAGGTAGSDTIGPAVTSHAHDPAFVAALWAIGILKALGGLLALALVQPWGLILPRRVLLTLAGGGGILMVLYGGASWVQSLLMAAGAIPVSSGLGHTAALWHAVLWDPWWLLGGILFVTAAWFSGQRASGHDESTRSLSR